MNQNSVKVIGINDESRKDANLSYVDKADGLKSILSSDFDDWSNFDSWERINIGTTIAPNINFLSFINIKSSRKNPLLN